MNVHLLNDDQYRVRFDERALDGRQLRHGAGAGGPQLVFHLHGLDHHETLTGCHCIANLYKDLRDPPGHRRHDALRAVPGYLGSRA